eukprot:Polyplicarium_translucidae@DN288_c0_g1_i1.p1
MRSHVYTAYILPEAKDEGGFRLVMQSATTDPLFQPRKRLLEEFLGWKRVFRERLSSNEVTDSTLGTMRAEARIAAGTRTDRRDEEKKAVGVDSDQHAELRRVLLSGAVNADTLRLLWDTFWDTDAPQGRTIIARVWSRHHWDAFAGNDTAPTSEEV